MKKKEFDKKLSLFFTIAAAVSILQNICGNRIVQPENMLRSAYLDPGTGTMIISAIVGVFATIGLGVKTFWYKIVRIFKPAAKDVPPSKQDTPR